jgi:hypothetical protein
MLPIILLVGKAGSGKDTIASALNSDGKGKVIALADPIKEMVLHLFQPPKEILWGPSHLRNTEISLAGLSKVERTALYDRIYDRTFRHFLDDIEMTDLRCELDDWMQEYAIQPKSTTYRKLLQTLGTEWGRKCNPNVWINYALKRANAALDTADFVVISDGRFRNEVLAVKKIGGYVMEVIKPNETSTATHASETEQDSIPKYWYDTRFVNERREDLMSDKFVADVVSAVRVLHG